MIVVLYKIECDLEADILGFIVRLWSIDYNTRLYELENLQMIKKRKRQ